MMDATVLTVRGSAGPPEAALKSKPRLCKSGLASSDYHTFRTPLACECLRQNRLSLESVTPVQMFAKPLKVTALLAPAMCFIKRDCIVHCTVAFLTRRGSDES